jgi:PP-loop superfamily ATP-utilizing enzyme
LKQIGYAHVTVDLQGYRRGSLNETGGSPNSFAPQPVGHA